jgi:hypothetical protein
VTKLGVVTSTGVPVRNAAPVARISPALPGPPAPDPVVAVGNICDPDNISDADAASATAQQLVCQLTSETTQVQMPGSFQNALMGDVILSPGGDGGDQIIAALLRALTPPQYYSHSGLMTENYVQITHCTAAASRLSDNTTGLEGAGGIQPDVLEYAWPGSITQTVDAAITGEWWIDPLGRKYYIGGFTPENLGITTNEEFILIPPLVVKPLAQNEEQVRPALRNAATLATTKGARIDGGGNVIQKAGAYYCWYGYSKPEIATGFSDPAGADAGWAEGASPAVCSSFVWLNMKATNIPLVSSNPITTLGDLAATAIAEGAQINPETRDGLFYYPASERQQAAQILNQIFENQVLQHEGFFKYIPFASSIIATDIADQIMNAFAFNNPNMYGSSAWQNPGDANAVSPFNITWWNPPYFGYSEPLQYLQAHPETYTTSRWTKVITWGTVSGIVSLNGAPITGVYVYVYDGKSATTDANGRYQLNQVPVGSYNMKAQVVVNGIQYQDSITISLTVANPNLTVNIPLQALPIPYRRLDLLYQIACDHDDDNPFNTHGWQFGGPDQQSIPLGPGSVTGNCSYTFDYSGGGYFRIEYGMNAVLLQDLSIEVTITATMKDDGSGNEQGEHTITFNVPLDGEAVWELDLECDGAGYHNGMSKFTGSARNLQETT